MPFNLDIDPSVTTSVLRSQRLFKRAASVTLARSSVGAYFQLFPNAIIIKDLRIRFSVEKTSTSEPNTCEVVISNLSKTTRGEFQTKPLHVELDAGYEGNLKRLFTGDVRWVQSTREAPDWETKIQAGDGERAYQHARVNRSFKSGVSKKTVLKDIASSMGLSIPTSAAEATALVDQFTSGVTLQGPSAKEMTRILDSAGMSWSLQDEQLQILPNDTAREGQADVISADTGMIGSPEFGTPTEKGKPPTLAIVNLLYPELTPGGKIQVKSEAINGLFRITRSVHSGDTWGDEWYTTLEAKPI